MKIITMKALTLAGIVVTALSGNVMADHNSPFGAGWANMPNDIHNTVTEDSLRGTAFRDFISRGAGADSVNRYSDGTRSHSRSSSSRSGGSASRSGGGGGRGGRG